MYQPSYVLRSGSDGLRPHHATQDEVSLPDVKVRLRQGGGVDASAKLVNYRTPAPAVQPAAAMTSTKRSAPKTAPKTVAKGGPQQEAAIHARIFGIRPETVFEIIAIEKYEN